MRKGGFGEGMGIEGNGGWVGMGGGVNANTEDKIAFHKRVVRRKSK